MFLIAWVVGFVWFVEGIFTYSYEDTKWIKIVGGGLLMLLSSIGMALGIE